MPAADFMTNAKTDRDRSTTQRLRELLDAGDIDSAQNYSAQLRAMALPGTLGEAAQESARRFSRAGVLTRMDNPDPVSPYERAMRLASERPGLVQNAGGESRYYAPRSNTGQMLLQALGNDPYAPASVRQQIAGGGGGGAAEPQAAPVTRRRREEAEPVIGARGVVGATVGSVNGKEMLVPMAGQYNNFIQNAPMGLNSQYGIDRGEFEQRRQDVVTAQERGRQGQAFEQRRNAKRQAEAAAAQHTQEMEDKILLETIKNHGVNAPGIEDWMQANGQVRKQQQEYDKIAATTVGKQPDEEVQIGQESRTVAEWRRLLKKNPRPSMASYEDWIGGQSQLGDPRFSGSRLRNVAGNLWGDNAAPEVDLTPLAGKEKEALAFFSARLLDPDPKKASEARAYVQALSAKKS